MIYNLILLTASSYKKPLRPRFISKVCVRNEKKKTVICLMSKATSFEVIMETYKTDERKKIVESN